ncbi:unnamed protein product [Acanthosepion pharaonis]|uniref:DUF7041 domain-containing protein n=1 Tax=Acanthosepion pharaonis TaxID=158019 RepID=A0A812DI21_ACAPH|nr:unnamed protein product [Sepia pharaonis]
MGKYCSAPGSDGAAVLVNLPVFNTMNVHVWFSQLSAIFQAKRIQSQSARFAYVVEKLPPDIASEVTDLLDNVPTENPFDVLKEAIIYRTGKSEERRINDLFNTLQLDQSKSNPTTMEIEKTFWIITICQRFCYGNWLYKLLTHTAQILAILPEDLDLLRVAAIADKIVEKRTLNSTHISSTGSTPHDDILQIQQQIDELSTQLERLSRVRSRPAYNAYKSRHHSRANSNTRRKPITGICWYHQKFGQAARHCSKPCHFNGRSTPTTKKQARKGVPNSA